MANKKNKEKCTYCKEEATWGVTQFRIPHCEECKKKWDYFWEKLEKENE